MRPIAPRGVHAILMKTGFKSNAEIIAYAIRTGLL